MDWKKDKHKIIAVILFLATITIASVIYYSAYSIPGDDEEKIRQAVIDYVEEPNLNLQLVEIKQAGDHMYATYKTDKPSYTGIVSFERGINMRWWATQADYGISPPITMFHEENQVVIYGIDCGPEIASYTYDTNSMNYAGMFDDPGEPAHFSNQVTNPNFIDVYETEKPYRFSFPDLVIYDKQGNDITWDLRDEIEDSEEMGSGFKATAETGIIIILTLIVFLAGSYLAIHFWQYKEEE